MVVIHMKLSRAIYLVLSLLLIICMYLCIRFHVLQTQNNLNGVILTEVVFILISSTILMQYYIRRYWEENMKRTDVEDESEKFQVQLCRMDHTEDLIHIVMKDILILGRDISITHIAFPKEQVISSQHCRLVYKNHVMYLEDLSSTNGTYYHGERIQHQTPIQSGDLIMIANIPFRISWTAIEKH